MNKLVYALAILMLNACSTTYQETTDWELKGGYYETKLGEGFYRVTGKTDIKIRVDFKEAENLFKSRSIELCPSGEYAVMEKKHFYLQDEPMTGMVVVPVPALNIVAFIPAGKANKPTVTHVEGLILCSMSPLTIEQARELVDENT